MRILCVDDEPLMLQMLEMAVKEAKPDADITAFDDQDELLEDAKSGGCDIAFPAEPVASGSMISVGMLEEWVIPNLEKLKAMLPEYKYFFTHICGDSLTRVPYLRDIGVRAFSCDYMVDLDKALENTEGKMVIMGNMNPAGSRPASAFVPQMAAASFLHPAAIWVPLHRLRMS